MGLHLAATDGIELLSRVSGERLGGGAAAHGVPGFLSLSGSLALWAQSASLVEDDFFTPSSPWALSPASSFWTATRSRRTHFSTPLRERPIDRQEATSSMVRPSRKKNRYKRRAR